MSQGDVEAIKEFVARGARCDTTACQELYHRFVGMVRKIALRCRNAAEDIAQETFLKTFIYLKKGRPIENFGGFVAIAAQRTCVDVLRKEKHRARSFAVEAAEPSGRGMGPLENVVRPEEENQLWNCVQQLPERQREVVILHYYLGMRIDEISETLGVNREVVDTALSRGRANLRKSLNEKERRDRHET